MRILTGALLLLISGCSQAGLVPLFDDLAGPLSAPDDQLVARCRTRLADYPPYDGPLQMESKYDQSRASKDVIDARAAHRYRQQVEDIYRYLAFLGEVTERMRSEQPATRAAAAHCFTLALTRWAGNGALEDRIASKQGEAVRKWFLAAVATNMMKAEALSGWQADTTLRGWLATLADRVQTYASPRRQRMDLYNNHDYWSCWAVMAAALVLDDRRRMDWAEQGYWLAIDQIEQRGSTVVLPHEAARGKRAAEYHAFALTPLIMMAEAGSRNGRPFYEGKGERLHVLAALVVQLWRGDGQREVFPGKQEPIDDYKMAWWPVYAHRFPLHLPLERKLASKMGSRFTGGSLAGLWALPR